jgi:hypothetical protein
MSQPIPARLAIATAITLFAGCGTTAGGGGGISQNVGGAPGSDCNPQVHDQGCFASSKMQCDLSAKWVEIGACVKGEYCVEKADPADGTGMKKIAACEEQPVYNQPDASSIDDGTTTGPKTPADEVNCVKQKCPTPYAACMAEIACATTVNCQAKCMDNACKDACLTISENDQKAGHAYLAVLKCSKSAACAGR